MTEFRGFESENQALADALARASETDWTLAEAAADYAAWLKRWHEKHDKKGAE